MSDGYHDDVMELSDVHKTDPRFWRRVVEDEGGCWLWTGASFRQGYGHVRRGNRSISTHRYAHELLLGAIPDGLCVLHRCDVRGCVNPSHLFLGTYADNAADRHAKGRDASHKGILNGRAKLTPESVQQIRERSAAGEAHSQLGTEFGVNKTTIGDIVSGKIWGHLPLVPAHGGRLLPAGASFDFSALLDSDERFWSRVQQSTSGCWIWTGSKHPSGHGQFTRRINGRQVGFHAHRHAYQLAYGSIPSGQCVLHVCDIAACVNPAHLVTGTRTQNNVDMRSKRRARGPNSART